MFSPPSKIRSKEAYKDVEMSGWFSNDIVAIAKVDDSGTENTSQSTIFSSLPSGKRATSEQYKSSLFPMCGTTQTTMLSEESDQKACFTFVSSYPTGRRRCVIVVAIIGIVFFAVPLISLAATGYFRDNYENGNGGQATTSSAPTAAPVSNPTTGSNSNEDIFRHRVPHTFGEG
jgi:hypothetical protein